MKVLIWKSYGDIEVYDASTTDKLAEHIETIISCLDNWGMEEDIEIVRKKVAAARDYQMMVRAYRWLVDAINPGHDVDNFEYLELTELK